MSNFEHIKPLYRYTSKNLVVYNLLCAIHKTSRIQLTFTQHFIHHIWHHLYICITKEWIQVSNIPVQYLQHLDLSCLFNINIYQMQNKNLTWSLILPHFKIIQYFNTGSVLSKTFSTGYFEHIILIDANCTYAWFYYLTIFYKINSIIFIYNY